MSLHYRNSVGILIWAAFILAIAASLAQAQQPHKAKERVESLKRTRLADILYLNREEADKFFAKYEQLQMKADAARKDLREAVAELERATQKKAGDLSKRSEAVFEKQTAYNNAIIDKIRSLKPLLTDEQYAKLVIFEHNFPLQLQKMLIKRAKRHHGDGDHE